MIPTSVADVLAENALTSPNLEALTPNINEFSVLLCQPKGDLLISNAGIFNRDKTAAVAQFKSLLSTAARQAIELVVTPEYSVPWDALSESFLAGQLPPEGCLWVLGCESITPAALLDLKQRLAATAVVIYEDLTTKARGPQTFTDPLVYVFRTKHEDGTGQVVALIQFKTHPSVDEDHIETDGLILGSRIYMFGSVGRTVRLFSLICSDVLSPDVEEVLEQYDGTLILHIQLNPKPRESAYRAYRKHLFSVADDNTELICLNWAAHVHSAQESTARAKDWKNIGGSAWYLRPDKLDQRDATVAGNHRAGLYYTWHDGLKCAAMFINYEPAAYVFRTSKAWHHGVPRVQSRRLGPRSTGALCWDVGSASWVDRGTVEDGFQALVQPHRAEGAPLMRLHQRCPIAVERLLALLDRAAWLGAAWYAIEKLASCVIDEQELISRITFAQDPDQGRVQYREDRIQHFVNASRAMGEIRQWPPELQDLGAGYEWQWDPRYPHSSLRSQSGAAATIVYAAENPLPERLQRLGDAVRALLWDAGQTADRLGIVYRVNGVVSLWRHPVPRRFDLAQGSPTDFTEG